jgi:hypothetical protein
MGGNEHSERDSEREGVEASPAAAERGERLHAGQVAEQRMLQGSDDAVSRKLETRMPAAESREHGPEKTSGSATSGPAPERSADSAARIRLAEAKESPSRGGEVERAQETRVETEETRMKRATESMRKFDWLQPEKWKGLGPEERRNALEGAGRYLRDAYEFPEPPLMPRKFPEYEGKVLLGFYSDGPSDKNLKADYELALNQQLLDARHNHPRQALETYSHEFRHAYQHEMAGRFKNGLGIVHDRSLAAEWAKNLDNYQHPDEDFERYREQPVERDAREFSQRLARGLYDDTHDGVDKKERS